MSIILYADGSSLGNPGPGGWGVVALLSLSEVEELGGAHPHTTNNRMELTAAIEALREFLPQSMPIEIRTDSSYLINGATKWIHGWEKNGWITTTKKPVENKPLWEDLSALLKQGTVTFTHVPGHQGVPGNERADEIAQGMAGGEDITLYRGSYENYGIDLLRTPPPGRSKRSAPYAYLSMVNGIIERHATWEECLKRVKGVSGAAYCKVFSPEEEREVVTEWKSRA